MVELCWRTGRVIEGRHRHWQVSNQVSVATISQSKCFFTRRPCKEGSLISVSSIYTHRCKVDSFIFHCIISLFGSFFFFSSFYSFVITLTTLPCLDKVILSCYVCFSLSVLFNLSDFRGLELASLRVFYFTDYIEYKGWITFHQVINTLIESRFRIQVFLQALAWKSAKSFLWRVV